MGSARGPCLAYRAGTPLAGGSRAIPRHARVVPPGHQRAALGPSSQRHRVAVPPDWARPVRAMRRQPHRAQPGFGRSADSRVPLQLPPPAREYGLSRRPRSPGGVDERGSLGCRRARSVAPGGAPARHEPRHRRTERPRGYRGPTPYRPSGGTGGPGPGAFPARRGRGPGRRPQALLDGIPRGSGGGRLFRRSCPGSKDYSR